MSGELRCILSANSAAYIFHPNGGQLDPIDQLANEDETDSKLEAPIHLISLIPAPVWLYIYCIPPPRILLSLSLSLFFRVPSSYPPPEAE